jgi:hypothetical protein
MGGVGVGRGEPLVTTLRMGGVGVGRGEPLVTTLRMGGVGVGRGEPLLATRPEPGGVGVGRGDPLRIATVTRACRLLDKCLTELLTGSRIETAKTQSARRIEIIFFMVENLLRPTMKENWKY